MNAVTTALAKAALKILWNKKTATWLIRHANEQLAKRVNLSGKETYAAIVTDALAEVQLRASCVSDDGTVSDAENEKIIARDLELLEKYWKE